MRPSFVLKRLACILISSSLNVVVCDPGVCPKLPFSLKEPDLCKNLHSC